MKREEEKKEMKDKNNRSNNNQLAVYNSRLHLKELFKEILKNHTKDGFEKFEEISIYIKKKFGLKKFQFKKIERIPKNIIDLTNYEKTNLIEQNRKIKKKELIQINSYMDDLFNHSKILEWAGIGFNNTEFYKLNLSIRVFIFFIKEIIIRNSSSFAKIFWENIREKVRLSHCVWYSCELFNNTEWFK